MTFSSYSKPMLQWMVPAALVGDHRLRYNDPD